MSAQSTPGGREHSVISLVPLKVGAGPNETVLVRQMLVGVAGVTIPTTCLCPCCALPSRPAKEFALLALKVTLQEHSPSIGGGTQSPSGDVVVPLAVVIGNALGHCCGEFDLYTSLFRAGLWPMIFLIVAAIW